MRASLAALLALAALLLAATPASACAMEPPTVCHVETEDVAVCVQGICPPASPGYVIVRAFGLEVRVPILP